jgi:hypothetical protein
MNLVSQKQEIIQWIKNLDDVSILNEIQMLKSKQDFNFEKSWKKGLTIEEARKKSKDFIQNLNWEK